MYSVDTCRKSLSDRTVEDLIRSDREEVIYPARYEARTESNDEWFIDQLRKDTLTDPHQRFRGVTDAYEASGSAASGHEYSHFDEDFCSDMHEHIIRYYPPENGLELQEHKTQDALNAVDAITEYTPPKWRLIHPSRIDKANREMATVSAEDAVFTDSKVTRYIDYDRFRIAMEAQEELHGQVTHVGELGDKPRPSFYETHAPVEGSSDQLTQMKCHLSPAEAITYPELAADLLSRPTTLMERYYRCNPTSGARLREVLAQIAEATNEDDLSEDEFRIMRNLIKHHIDEMEINKVYDPTMIQFVAQGDPRYIETSALRDTYEKVCRVVCGESEEVQDAFSSILFPLAVHMRERNIPITVENVIEEGDGVLQAHKIVLNMVGTYKDQITRGGPQAFLDAASDEELDILNQTSKSVIALLMPGHNRAATFLPIYGEEDEDVDRIAHTMYGPRRQGGTSDRPEFSSGGYYQQGAKFIYGMDQRTAPFEKEQSQQLTYSPYTEAHEFLRRTRLRRFIPPTY